MLWDHSPLCPVCNVGVLWPNSWMDQNATWYRGRGGRPRPRRHCVRWGPSSPTERGTATPLIGLSIVAKRSPISATAELLLYCWCASLVHFIYIDMSHRHLWGLALQHSLQSSWTLLVICTLAFGVCHVSYKTFTSLMIGSCLFSNCD